MTRTSLSRQRLIGLMSQQEILCCDRVRGVAERLGSQQRFLYHDKVGCIKMQFCVAT